MRIYTQGSFDILHRGHLRLLERSKRLGDMLMVSILSDRAYKAYRGYPPALSWWDRAELVMELKYVDAVREGDHRKTKQEILDFKPDVITVGSDWAKKDIYAQYGITQGWLDERDILLVYLPYTDGISSTQIKQRLCKNS